MCVSCVLLGFVQCQGMERLGVGTDVLLLVYNVLLLFYVPGYIEDCLSH